MANGTQIRNLFNDALELDPDRRTSFVAEACGSDVDLRNEVQSLLDLYCRVETFLDVPAAPFSAAAVAAEILESEEASAIGKLVGAYRIEKEIGRGGMGAVYLANRDDQAFQKRVAIKLVRRGTENESVIRRFENERQILADLEHPNIAHLIDGGLTENGLPYFVMEYVDGSPVDRFCDERNLSIRERLEIFRKICSAVEFAHEHSVIHRDIKPSNILVRSDGTPKLLDFGIAKVLENDSRLDQTATAFRVMTPEYASPEQVRGERVGKFSDVYSLGVVLYQLVDGCRPFSFASKSPYEIGRSICEEEPPPPSAALRDAEIRGPRLPSSLDTIVLKALRKEQARRYASVSQFSEDVRRCLEGLPISASGDTLYRGVKFLKRHAWAVLPAFGLLILVLLVGFSLGLFNQASIRNDDGPALSSTGSIQHLPTARDKGGSENAEARDLYFGAQALWDQRSVIAIQQASELFERAVAKDPEFALAYSGLSNCYFLLSVWAFMPSKEAFPKAKEASLNAIRIAPHVAEGHLSLAMVYWLYEYDWKLADLEFKQAIELDPQYARAPHWYGLFLAEMGRFDEAVASERRALEFEPNSAPVSADMARVFFYARRYDESLEQYRKTMAMNPDYRAFYAELSDLYQAAGMLNEWLDVEDKRGDSGAREAYVTGGMTEYQRRLQRSLQKSDFWRRHYANAAACSFLGDKDEAFKQLNKALEVRDHQMAQLKVNPKFDNLRSDPRFTELLHRMNLDE